MQSTNALDIGIVAIALLFLCLGVYRGFFQVILGFIGSILGLGFGIAFSRPFGDRLTQFISLKSSFSGRIIAFFIIYIGFWILGLAVGFLIRKLLKTLKLGWVDRMMGGAFGILKAAVFILVILMIGGLFPAVRPIFEKSVIAPAFISGGKTLFANLPDDWKSYLDPHRWIGQPPPLPTMLIKKPGVSKPKSQSLK